MGKSTARGTEGKQYKVKNWKEYNESLVQRGDITLWLEEDVISRWEHDNNESKVGAPFFYSDEAILCLLSIREVFRLTYRQTEGFGRSLVRLMDADIKIPDYTSLQKRAAKLNVCLNTTSPNGNRDIVIDSTGLKVYGEGEWKSRKHGVSQRRTWRKFHIGIDPNTGEIIAEQLTGNGTHDSKPVEDMIDQVEEPISRFFGDGAYDHRSVYDVLDAKCIDPIIPPRKNSVLWQHGNSKKPKLPRDQAVREIRRSSRRAWKVKVDYHIRSLGETVMYRLKTIFGPNLKNRLLPNQKTEASIRCKVLNKFTQLGRPDFAWD